MCLLLSLTFLSFIHSFILLFLQHNRLKEMGFKEEWIVAAMGASNNDEVEAMRILLQQHWLIPLNNST